MPLMRRAHVQDWMVVVFCVALMLPCGFAQTRAQAQATVPALMVSDIHFEPFWDPAKAAELAKTPVSGWRAILSSPQSPDRAQRFAEVQKSCHAKGVDTSYPLFDSSLRAMRADAAGPKFITVSGDLIAHDFDCKFAAVFPHAAASDYQAFVAKTIAFVESELHDSFPTAALYTALGNNDSDCGDYKLDEHGTMLANVGPAIAANLGVPEGERKQAEKTLIAGGDYNVPMAAPMGDARMVVIDNLFLAKRYSTCSGAADPKAAADQIAWLRDQLETARRDHQKVWVMGHIPTGIDPYSTARKMRDVCGGEPADMFLSSDALGNTLAEFGDVIRLVIFAHTHMDELRLLEPAGGASVAHPAVAVKMVSSISPVDGNNPSFTVARVSTVTAELVDYEVYAASNQTGVDMTWTKEYDFADTYHEPAFTASTVADLIAGFRADKGAQTAASQSYLRNYFVGDFGSGKSVVLKNFWVPYVCALGNQTAESYRACTCADER